MEPFLITDEAIRRDQEQRSGGDEAVEFTGPIISDPSPLSPPPGPTDQSGPSPMQPGEAFGGGTPLQPTGQPPGPTDVGGPDPTQTTGIFPIVPAMPEPGSSVTNPGRLSDAEVVQEALKRFTREQLRFLTIDQMRMLLAGFTPGGASAGDIAQGRESVPVTDGRVGDSERNTLPQLASLIPGLDLSGINVPLVVLSLVAIAILFGTGD